MTEKEKSAEFIQDIQKYLPSHKVIPALKLLESQLHAHYARGYIDGGNDLLPIAQQRLEDKFWLTYARSEN